MIVNLGNDIKCLNSPADPLVISVYQPKNDLITSTTLGPHVNPAAVETVTLKITQFLSSSIANNAQLIIMPEYGMPVQTFLKLCKREIVVPSGTFIVAPLETIAYSNYQKLISDVSILERVKCNSISPVNQVLTSCCVNSCVVIAYRNDEIELYFQPKRHASKWERGNLCTSNGYYIFEGDGIALTVIICSDANTDSVYGQQLKDLHSCRPGRIIVHTQWNPSANKASVFADFWTKSLSWGATENGSVVLISCNVASGSKIEVEGTSVLETMNVKLPYTRVSFSGNGKPDDRYMDDNLCAAFKSLLDGTNVQQYHFAFQDSSSHIFQIKRPVELVHAADRSSKLIHKYTVYLDDDSTLGKDRLLGYLKKTFKEKIAFPEDKIDITFLLLKDFYMEDFEKLLCSVAINDKYTWLDNDILKRPIIWALFYSDEYSSENDSLLDWFKQGLLKLSDCIDAGYKPIFIEKYPVNLENTFDKSYGWLFHCQGLSNDVIVRKINKMITGLSAKPGFRLKLFAIGSSAKLKIERPFIDISNPEPMGLGRHSQTEPQKNIDILDVINL